MGRGQQHVEQIGGLCAERGIPLLEDIAQSFGVSVRGRRAGTFGLAAWCSLNHHKLLSTGDGGFVLVSDEGFFAKLSALHDQGCVMQEGKRRPAAIVEPGLSLRTSELTAAVLRAQLARYHFIRLKILRMYGALAEACNRALELDVLPAHRGDLPFTVLFRRNLQIRYPSIAESGWHVAPQVPWLAMAYSDAAQSDPALGATLKTLNTISAVGAGFVDPYYATPLGLSISDSVADVPQIVGKLRDLL
jgi:hypothetical protein